MLWDSHALRITVVVAWRRMLGDSHALRITVVLVVAACMLWDSHALRITIVVAAACMLWDSHALRVTIVVFIFIVRFRYLPDAEDVLARSAIFMTVAVEELVDHIFLHQRMHHRIITPVTFVLVYDAALIFVVFFGQCLQFHDWSNLQTTVLLANCGSLLVWTIWLPLLVNVCLPPGALAVRII